MSGKVPYLPIEVIIRILETCTSKATLAVATRCSRQWYDIAMPILYFHVDIGDSMYYARMTSDLRSLAILFQRKPTIAAHVRHFSLRPGFSEGPGSWAYQEGEDGETERDDTLLERFQKAFIPPGSGKEERVALLEEADCESDEPFLALLLLALPNLESLDLMGPWYAEYMELMLRHFGTSAARGSAFTKLKSVFWTYQQSRCLPTGAIISPSLFALPNVEKIYLHQACSADREVADERLARLSPRSSTCTHLELRNCSLLPSDIQTLLLLPKALRTLIYSIDRQHVDNSTVSFSTIWQGLEHHRGTLEELCLDYSRNATEGISRMANDALPMKSLSEFSSLKRLKIAPVFILGMHLQPGIAPETDRHLHILDFLPKSIEQLRLMHCEESDNLQMVLDALTHIGSKKTTRVPKLHEMVVEIDSDLVQSLADKFASVLKLAKDAGTNVVLLDNFECREDKGRTEAVERNWGFDEDIEWKECYESINSRPAYKVIHM